MKKECEKMRVGGQAVIEGVMMRAGTVVATSVRRKNGEIVTKVEDRVPWTKRNKLYGIPIIRGAVNMVEMLVIGIGTLNWSADIAMQDELAEKGLKKKENTQTWPAVLFGLVVGVGLFVLLPLLISKLFGFEKHAFSFNLVAGGVRMLVFFGYLVGISFLPDVKRLFRYHGAEHKTIYTFENGEPVTVENARKYTTLHPRCGTSFLLIIAVIAILFFAIADSIVAWALGFVPPIFMRFGIHLALWPLVIGLCYEALKGSAMLSERYKWARVLVLPGLAMQKISTAEPTDDMLEIAIAALGAAAGMERMNGNGNLISGSECSSKS
jgi:uncharacterized protein YqhQ